MVIILGTQKLEDILQGMTPSIVKTQLLKIIKDGEPFEVYLEKGSMYLGDTDLMALTKDIALTTDLAHYLLKYVDSEPSEDGFMTLNLQDSMIILGLYPVCLTPVVNIRKY